MKTQPLAKKLLIPLLLIEIAAIGAGLSSPAQSEPRHYCRRGELPPPCIMPPPGPMRRPAPAREPEAEPGVNQAPPKRPAPSQKQPASPEPPPKQ